MGHETGWGKVNLPVDVIVCDSIPEGWSIIVCKTNPITGKTRIVASRPDGSIVEIELTTKET